VNTNYTSYDFLQGVYKFKMSFYFENFCPKANFTDFAKDKKKESEIEKPVPFIMQQYVYYRKHADQ
jgi:hypothetical protein